MTPRLTGSSANTGIRLRTPRSRMEASPEAAKAFAALQDLAAAPASEKKELAVDHQLACTEVQLLLAEKRTAYSLMRTGVAVTLVPLSIGTVLAATSSLWEVWDSWWLLGPLGVLSILMFALGAYLVVHALRLLAHTDRVLAGLRSSDTLLEDLLISHGRADRVLRPWLWPISRRRDRGSPPSGSARPR